LKKNYLLGIIVALLLLNISLVSAAIADHVVISEIQIDSIDGAGGVEDDLVELYNPTDSPITLDGWSIQKTTGTFTGLYRKELTGTIPPYGYFLIVRNHADTTQSLKDAADILAAGTSFSLSDDNVIYLVNNNEDIIDQNDANIVDYVGLGASTIYEGSATINNPVQGGSIERKSGTINDDVYGNGDDTNDNSVDFLSQANPNPQNSVSCHERLGVISVVGQNCEHTTIQSAIDDATNGDTIDVEGGSYNENLVINKEVKIDGESQNSVTLTGNHIITVSNVYITEFTLVTTGTTITIDSSASIIDNVEIRSSIFDLTTSPSVGVYVGGGNPVNKVSNIVMESNTFNGPDSKACNPWKIGGSFGSPIGAEVDGVSFSDNTVNKCSIPLNLHDKDLANILINGNIFRDTDGVIYIWEDAGETPTGILSEFIFSDNDVDSTNSYGVGIDTASPAVFSDANFGSGNQIHSNDFVDVPGAYGFQSVSLLSTLTSYQLDTENNYWGDEDPSDDVSGNVDYDPFLYYATDDDRDTDGILSNDDTCPNDVDNDEDFDGICVGDYFSSPKTGDNDNCPTTLNADQSDIDEDGLGDRCDDDDGKDITSVDGAVILNNTNETSSVLVIETDSNVEVEITKTDLMDQSEFAGSGINGFKTINITTTDDSAVQFPVEFKVYYTDDELDLHGMNESQLVGIFYYNENNAEWELLNETGVDKTDVVVDGVSYSGYMWANLYHFSMYAPGVDITSPVASDLILDPQSTIRNGTVVNFTANITDETLADYSNIVAAEYFIDETGDNGTGNAMTALDGSYDNVSEIVNSLIDVTAFDRGSYTLYVHGNDENGNWGLFSQIVLTIDNAAPEFSEIGNYTTVQESKITMDISQFATDIDTEDNLTYSISSAIVGDMKINDTTGVFEWTPDHTSYGDNLVTFTVSDDAGLTDSQDINIYVYSTLNISDVNVNSADVEDEGIVQNVKPGDLITTTMDVKNIGSVNLDDVELSLESVDFVVDELVDLDIVEAGTTETATISFTVPYDAVEGVYDIDLDVIGDDHNDGDSRYSLFTYSLNVTKALDEIVISSVELGNDTIKCLDQTNITINVSNIGDLDQYGVNVTVANSALDFAKHNDTEDINPLETETYFFTIDTLGYVAGTYTIDIEAEYYNGAKVTSTAVLTIENCEPVFSGPIVGLSILEDTYDDTIDLTTYFDDKNNDTLTYSVNGNLTSLNFNDFSSTGLVNITPDADYVGVNDINFTASDASGIAFSGDVTITVTPVNDEPVLSAIGDKSATQGTEFTYQVTATDVDAEDILEYKLTPLNGTPLPTLTINQSGYIDSWTADIADVGEVYGINVEICDDSGDLNNCTNETFNILVNNANDAPTLATVSLQPFDEDSELQFDLYGADNDLNTAAGDTLTYACNLTGLTIEKINNTQANVTWTPVASDVGEYTINCTITDVAGASGYNVFDLTVNEVNDTPIIQPMQSQQIPALELFTLQVVAADEESDDITYSIEEGKGIDMAIDTTGALTWTPVDSEVGTHTVTIGASDGHSMDKENVTINVFKGVLIKNVYLVDDGVDISLTDNGQTSNILPGSVLGLKLTLENKFTDYTLYDIAVDATVDSLSDGETVYTLAPGTTTTIELSLGTLSNTALGDFVLDIIVDGDYDNNYVASATFNNTLTVESTRYMLIIQNPVLSEDNLSCNRATILSADVLNIGSRLQDETVTLNVANSALGLSQDSTSEVIAYNAAGNFDLDISIPHSQASATYPLTITATSERGTVSDPVTIDLIVSDCAVTLSPSNNNIVIGEDETKLFSIDGLSNLASPVVVWTTEDGSQLTDVSYTFTPASFTGNDRSYDIGVEISDDNGFSLTNTWLVTVTKIPYTTTYTTTPALSTFNETTIQNVTDFTIARNGYGSVQFKGPLDLSGCVDLDSVFYMDRGIIAIDSAACPALDEENVLVTLKGLTLTGDPRIKYKGTFTKDANDVNIACTTCNPTSPSDGVVIFTAAYGFSSYKVDTVIPTNSAVANAGSDQTKVVNTLVTLSGSASTGDAPLSYSWTAPSGITLSSTSIANPTFTPTTVGTYTFTLTASNSYGSSSDSVVITVNDGATSGASGNLTISDLDIKVGDKSEKDVRNGETIGRDAKPGDKVKFDIEVSNLFPKSSDIDMEDIEITITIQDIDDGGDDDLEEEETIDDLDAGDEDSIILEFDIPILVEEGDYDVVIEVTGEDDNGVDHDVRWELKLTVEKDKHDLIIDDADLTPSLIRCNRNPALSIDVVNIGTEDEDDVSIEITSDELGIDVMQRDIELEEGDSDDSIFEKTYRFKIDNSVDAGTYPITINVEYDGKSGDEKTLDLIIEDCVEIITPLESDELDIVDLITTTASTQPVKPASTTISFTETSEYLTLLVILFVLLAGGVIFLIGATIILINKR
jgi:hypothetical protein